MKFLLDFLAFFIWVLFLLSVDFHIRSEMPSLQLYFKLIWTLNDCESGGKPGGASSPSLSVQSTPPQSPVQYNSSHPIYIYGSLEQFAPVWRNTGLFWRGKDQTVDVRKCFKYINLPNSSCTCTPYSEVPSYIRNKYITGELWYGS